MNIFTINSKLHIKNIRFTLYNYTMNIYVDIKHFVFLEFLVFELYL